MAVPAAAAPPLPPHKPQRIGEAAPERAARTDDSLLASLPPLPRRRPEQQPSPRIPRRNGLQAPCDGALKSFAIVAEPMPAIAKGNCGREEVLKVTAVGTKRAVPLAAPALLSCDMAVALAKWVGGTVDPAAEALLGSPVASLDAGTSYACRTRNSQPGAKLSEHAYANAFDLPGLVLEDGTHVAVGPHMGKSRTDRFLTEIRGGACGPFNTVLGPGSDVYHVDHFHLDAATRRNPYCR